MLRILDLGTGSGVLAIAAARALRQPVLATDIDASAVRAARANARLNGVGGFVEVVRADGVTAQRLRARAPFALVFANMLLRPLQRFAAPLTKITVPGGHVVLSGLLPSQANAALAAYRALALERRIDLDGWTTLVLTRRARRAAAPRRRPPPRRRKCEGFRMPAAPGERRLHRRPASESLRGRKPRWGNVWRCRGRYGDLHVASAPCELRGGNGGQESTQVRCLNGLGRANTAALIEEERLDWRANCVFGRAAPWPVRKRRQR